MRAKLIAIGAPVLAVLVFLFVHDRLLVRAACNHPTLTALLLSLGPSPFGVYKASEVAISCDNVDGLRRLLAHEVENQGQESLRIAAIVRKCDTGRISVTSDLVEILRLRKVDIDVGIVHAPTPECVRSLLALGAKCESPEWSCLASQKLNEHPEVFEEILKTGVDPNHRDAFGWTPLHRYPPPEIVSLLLKYGADPDATDKEGRTAVDLALEANKPDVAAYLKAQGLKPLKYLSAKHAENVRFKDQEAGILRNAMYRGGEACQVGVNVGSGNMLSVAGDQWATAVGTTLKVSAQCSEGRVLHWALLHSDGTVEQSTNIGLLGGSATFEVNVSRASGGAPLVFFASDGSVQSLAKAVEDGDAWHATNVKLTAGTPQNR